MCRHLHITVSLKLTLLDSMPHAGAAAPAGYMNTCRATAGERCRTCRRASALPHRGHTGEWLYQFQLIFGGVGRRQGTGLDGHRRRRYRIPGCGLGRGLSCLSRRRGIRRRWPSDMLSFPGIPVC